MTKQPAFTILETLLYSLFLAAGLLLVRMSVQSICHLAMCAHDALRVHAYHRTAFFYLYRDLSCGRLVPRAGHAIVIEQAEYASKWQKKSSVVMYDWQGNGLRRAVNKEGARGRRIYIAPVPHHIEITEHDINHYCIVYEPEVGVCWQATVMKCR